MLRRDPSEEIRDAWLTQRELATALRLSLQNVAYAPLPEQMALLLMKLAMVELMQRLSDGEPEQGEDI